MTFRTASIVYAGALLFDIAALLTGSETLELIAKPALMPILIWYFSSNTEAAVGPRNLLTGALVFSWFGDIFLLFDKSSGGLFVFGLAAFLIAHLAYIGYFVSVRKLNGISGSPNLAHVILPAFYGAALLGFILPFVDDLLVPVAVYAAVITTMLAASLSAFDFAKSPGARLCVAGTGLFVVSDSILAVNRFLDPIPYGPVLVMITYAAAQFLITEGAIRNLAQFGNKKRAQRN